MNEPLPVIRSAGALTLRLEELLKGGDGGEQFLQDVARLSAGPADAPWEVLAVVDQLYRRGKLSADLFRAARVDIERRALSAYNVGAPNRAAGQSATAPRSSSEVKPLRPLASTPPAVRERRGAQRRALELEQLREELEQVRREAAQYTQRLQQLEARAAALANPGVREPMEDTAPAARPARTQALPPSVRSLWAWCLALLVGGLGVLAYLFRVDPLPPPPVAAVVPPAPPPAPEPPRPGVLTLEAPRYMIAAGERQALVTVQRLEGSDGEVTVQWRLGAGSARRGRDFAGATRGRLTLPAGVAQAQIAIPLLRNPERRHIEYLDLRLQSADGGARLGEVQHATLFLMPPAPATAPRPQ
ncbi:MAG: hypothetical protein U1F39_01185 [Steroidobacteraceae bacterium]